MEIKTPLDIISIALQDGRENNQKSSSKQSASATPLFVKHVKPQILKPAIKVRTEESVSLWACRIQEFKKWIKIMAMSTPPALEGTESIKVTQPEKTGSAAATPFKGKKSVHSVPFIKDH